MMKKLILLSVLAFVISSCGYEIRKKPEPPKPKLTKEQIRKQEYEQRLKDYDVQFLFECNGVKVYRFMDDARQLHHATEEEKQLLFDKMKEQCLRWNAEEKRVEHIRWRAKKGERYYSINCIMESIIRFIESGDICDNGLWNALVYFRTEEQAKEAVKRVKETLRQYHEEIGG